MVYIRSSSGTPKATHAITVSTSTDLAHILINSSIKDGTIAEVAGINKFKWDSTSTASASNSVIVPTDGTNPGRWVLDTGSVLFLSDLRNIAPTSLGRGSIIIDGYSSSSDGGEGHFNWDTVSTAADNNGTIIKVTGITTGRWRRQFSGPVSIAWFGAKANTEFGTAVTTADSSGITVSGITLDQSYVGKTIWIRGIVDNSSGIHTSLTNVTVNTPGSTGVAYLQRVFTCDQVLGYDHRGHYIEIPGAGTAGGLHRTYISKVDETTPQYKIGDVAATTLTGSGHTATIGGDNLVTTILSVSDSSHCIIGQSSQVNFSATDIAIFTDNSDALSKAFIASDHVDIPPMTLPFGFNAAIVPPNKTLEIKRGGVMAVVNILQEGSQNSIIGYCGRVQVAVPIIPAANVIWLGTIGNTAISLSKTQFSSGSSQQNITVWNKFRTPNSKAFQHGLSGAAECEFRNLMAYDFHPGSVSRTFDLVTGMNTCEYHGIWAQSTNNSQVEIDGDDETGLGTSLSITHGIVITINTSTDVLTSTNPHGFFVDDAITLFASGTFPTTNPGGAFTQGGTAYVLSSGLTSKAFKISLTKGGAAIDFTSTASSGTITATTAISGGQINIQFNKFQLHQQKRAVKIGAPGNFNNCATLSFKNGVIEHIGTIDGYAFDIQQANGVIIEGMHCELGAEKNQPNSGASTNAIDQGRDHANRFMRLGTDNDLSIASGIKVTNNPELGGAATMFEGVSFDGISIGDNAIIQSLGTSGGDIPGLFFWNRGNTRAGSFGARANIQIRGGNSWIKSTNWSLIDNTTGLLLNINENQIAGSAPSQYIPTYQFPGILTTLGSANGTLFDNGLKDLNIAKITGAAAWFEGDRGLATDASSWIDFSNTGGQDLNLATNGPTYNSTAVNNLPAITFVRTSSQTLSRNNINVVGTGAHSGGIVVMFNSVNNNDAIFGNSSTTGGITLYRLPGTGNGRYSLSYDSVDHHVNDQANVIVGKWQIVTWHTSAGGALTLRVDGVAKTFSVDQQLSPTQGGQIPKLTIGARWNDPGSVFADFSDITVAAVFMGNRDVSSRDLKLIEQMWSTKYDVVITP